MQQYCYNCIENNSGRKKETSKQPPKRQNGSQHFLKWDRGGWIKMVEDAIRKAKEEETRAKQTMSTMGDVVQSQRTTSCYG